MSARHSLAPATISATTATAPSTATVTTASPWLLVDAASPISLLWHRQVFPAAPQHRAGCTQYPLNKPFPALYSLCVPVPGPHGCCTGLSLLPISSLPLCSPPSGSVQPSVVLLTSPAQKDAGQAVGEEAWGLLRKVSMQVGGSSRNVEAKATPHTHHDRAKRSPTGQSPPSRSPGEKCQLGSALHPDRNFSPQGAGCHRDPPLSPYLTLDHEPPHLAARLRCPSRSPLTGQAENWGAGGRCMQDTWAGEGSAV